MLAVFRERECEFNASLFTGIHLDICQKALRVSGRNLNGIGKRMQLRGLYFDEEPVWIKDIHGLSNSFEYVKMLSDKINQLTPKDAGILFSGFDDRFLWRITVSAWQ